MGVIGFLRDADVRAHEQHQPAPLARCPRFGQARVWGTASWLCVVWIVSAYLERAGGGSGGAPPVGFELRGGHVGDAQALRAQPLPTLSPAKFGRGALEAIGALGMLKNRERFSGHFLGVYVACGALFQVNVILQGFVLHLGAPGSGIEPAVREPRFERVAAARALVVPPCSRSLLARFGVKKVVLVGVLAWPLRCAVYFLGRPTELVVLTAAPPRPQRGAGYFALPDRRGRVRTRRPGARALHALLAAGGSSARCARGAARFGRLARALRQRGRTALARDFRVSSPSALSRCACWPSGTDRGPACTREG